MCFVAGHLAVLYFKKRISFCGYLCIVVQVVRVICKRQNLLVILVDQNASAIIKECFVVSPFFNLKSESVFVDICGLFFKWFELFVNDKTYS